MHGLTQPNSIKSPFRIYTLLVNFFSFWNFATPFSYTTPPSASSSYIRHGGHPTKKQNKLRSVYEKHLKQ